ncbi:MAG TPA: T9SS type A sorting domain-containing protein [Saprospiraceae bacterium]|nr:T9SS type A sorting domain-containing protein [Saprospiraceae bacterium]HMQ85093.1 T9SS type A sorting domain-containing protein [Saprospiraceae bacterium]
MIFKTFTKLTLAVLVATVNFGALRAQNVFWSEDFSAGIPASWTNADLSGNGAVWTWCNNPANGQGNGCPAIWGDGLNMQVPFASATASNGFVTVDSDAAGQITHISTLTTSAIDCSALTDVWVRFQAHIGVFTFDAVDNALLKVSTNGLNFQSFTIFPNLTTSERWSANPEVIQINISDIAAGASTVYLQWEWTANYEYHWSLDDIEVLDGDPRAPNDMRVNPFFAIAPNFSTPASQVDAIGFIADVENVGSATQSNAVLTISIEDENNTEVYSQQLIYAEVASDSLAENVFFPEEFTPAAEPANYTATYSIELQDEDGNPGDNTQQFSFSVTDTLFAKDNGVALGGIRPADEVAFTYGNIYYVPNGDGLFARYVTFGVSTPENVAGQSLVCFLYKFEGDLNTDGQANPEEYGAPLAFNFYQISGDEGDELITIPINLDDAVALEDDAHYMIVMNYAPDDDTELFLVSTNDLDYQAMQFYTDSLGMDRARYASALDVGNTGDFNLAGFAGGYVPVVRMSIGPEYGVNTNETQLPAGAMTVFPNPVKDRLVLDVALEQVADRADLYIFNSEGKLMQRTTYNGFQKERLEFGVQNWPSGNYFVKLLTNDNAAATRRFVIQR